MEGMVPTFQRWIYPQTPQLEVINYLGLQLSQTPLRMDATLPKQPPVGCQGPGKGGGKQRDHGSAKSLKEKRDLPNIDQVGLDCLILFPDICVMCSPSTNYFLKRMFL